jgi:hypothetical protein
LRGMEHLLKSNAELAIVVEFWVPGLIRSGTKPDQFLRYLQENDFEISVIDEVDGSHRPTTFTELLRTFPPDREEIAANLFCRRPSR